MVADSRGFWGSQPAKRALALPFCFSYDDISIWLCRDVVCGVCGCGWRRRRCRHWSALRVYRLLQGTRRSLIQRVRLLMLLVLLLPLLLGLRHLLVNTIRGCRLLLQRELGTVLG